MSILFWLMTSGEEFLRERQLDIGFIKIQNKQKKNHNWQATHIQNTQTQKINN